MGLGNTFMTRKCVNWEHNQELFDKMRCVSINKWGDKSIYRQYYLFAKKLKKRIGICVTTGFFRSIDGRRTAEVNIFQL